ncbi:hypothetical protein BDR03DRAFT_877262 [Suillus americanus]|nr:hypothetical protein BDR03DRAFT_877262 [Suillus americanus]
MLTRCLYISCGFSSMVMASSLGPLSRTWTVVCVLTHFMALHINMKHYPLRINGAGVEDFRTIKHIFSASNALSPII